MTSLMNGIVLLLFLLLQLLGPLAVSGNEFVVRIKEGTSAAQLAHQHGFDIVRKLDTFPNTYVFTRQPKLGKRIGFMDSFGDGKKETERKDAKEEGKGKDPSFPQDERIEWAEIQEAQVRVKRDQTFVIRPRPNTGPSGRHPPMLGLTPQQMQNIYGTQTNRKYPHTNARFNDELFIYQGYLGRRDEKMVHMNVYPVWNMGYTGKGVVVSIVDDGIEYTHPDLRQNYDRNASYDAYDNDDDPLPTYEQSNINSHGTKCAGEVAMAANNGLCGVGIAFEARIGGIRALDAYIYDATEAVALSFRNDYIDIYSSSWGPTDNGKTVEGPKKLTLEALEKGVKLGRRGLGVIYVWASGNGGSADDNCNCDGYVSSIYTLSIGAVTQFGHFPWYGERCASTIAVSYSSGSASDSKVVTTDLHHKCTVDHTGTSAAAPIAAGIVALLLQSRPDLTWRDVQHLVVFTSDFSRLTDNRGWRRNAAGLMYNSRFGFGLMDAYSLVKTAANWTHVDPLVVCNVSTRMSLPVEMSQTDTLIYFQSNGCRGTENEVNSLEHVQVVLTIEAPKRGALEIYLQSPSETISMLLSKRQADDSTLGFKSWPFTSVHFWGERSKGTWVLMVRDKSNGKSSSKGSIQSANLILYGTKNIPVHLKKPKVYTKEYLIKSTIESQTEMEEEEEAFQGPFGRRSQ